MTAGILRSPRKLEKTDKRSTFTSGADELDTWLRDFSWQNQRANNAVTYVAMLDGVVVGYYAIAAAGVSHAAASASFAKRRPDPIPCVLLARLAVDRRAQGKGVGSALFRDALTRTVQASEALGAAGMLIHCRDQAAKDFYLSLSDAIQSPLDDMQLLIPMKDIAAQVDI